MRSFQGAKVSGPDATSFWTAGGDTGEVVRFDVATGNKLASFSSGFVPPCPGGSCVGGLSVLPTVGGTMSQQTIKTTRWGFDVPSPGQPHRTKPVEDE
jgi:hypothetical protein